MRNITFAVAVIVFSLMAQFRYESEVNLTTSLLIIIASACLALVTSDNN